MNKLVLQTVTDYGLIEDGDKIIVALSGGADSVSLLDVLNSLKEKYHLTLYAAHVNHNLRGEESKRDENFCKILCEKYKIDLFIKSEDIGALAKQQKISEELCGRNVRYAFFDELSQKLDAKIATAHTASDNAETLLFNVARGSALGGVGAISPKRSNIIRPLIRASRADVEKYCAEHKLDYVTDSTNLCDDYTRNSIRHNIIPLFKRLNPSFEQSALNLSESAREATAFLNKTALKAERECKTDFGYYCGALMSLDKAVLKQLLIILFKKHCDISLEHRHIALLCDIIQNGGSVELSKLYTAVSKQGVFRIVHNSSENCFESVKLERNMEFSFNGKNYYVRELSGVADENVLNDDLLLQNSVFRTRLPGDVFTYPERNVTKPLRKVLNEQKIPSELRDSLIVLAVGSTVMWCEYVGASKSGKFIDKNKSLQIKIKGV